MRALTCAGAFVYPLGMQAEWRFSFAGASAARLYRIAADVEAYPGFLPGCIAARVTARGPAGWRVDNLFGVGPLRARFISFAMPEPPGRLRVTSDDGPWRRLALDWRFTDQPGGAVASLRVEAVFRRPMMEMVARSLLARLEPRLVAAFRRRLMETEGQEEQQ